MKKKNIIALTLAVLMCTAVLAGCGSKNEPSGNAAPTFTVGYDAEFPPYGYQDDDGEYVGFDLDLAQEVCDRNGWELVKKPIDWDSKDMDLESGSIDCIWNGFTINGREDDYTWTDAYVDNSQVFVVAADSVSRHSQTLPGRRSPCRRTPPLLRP
jgi:polar amino acid transport system substrate-binding protein